MFARVRGPIAAPNPLVQSLCGAAGGGPHAYRYAPEWPSFIETAYILWHLREMRWAYATSILHKLWTMAKVGRDETRQTRRGRVVM